MGKSFLNAFPAFKYKNYRLYFSGQLISLIGTWLQIVALGWLVLKMTNSAFWVGTVSALSTLPVLLFALFGGVIVDRFNKKKILYITQIIPMMLAFVLGFLTLFQKVNLVGVSVLAFLFGTVSALDNPARQAFVVEMVRREDLASAIALNSSIFNGARVIGPGIAGILIAAIGIGGTFIINGISFIAVIIALFFITSKKLLPQVHPHPVKAIKQGLSYSFSHPIIKTLLMFTGVISIFGWSYSTLMPVIAQNIFHQGPAVLGYLYSATGVGAVFAAIIISVLSKKLNPLVFILVGCLLFSLSVLSFTFIKNYIFALPVLFFVGFGLIMQFSIINSTIQHLVPDDIRGRVMSIYTLMFLGMFPIGSFQVGIIAERLGSIFAIRLGAIIVFAYGVYIFLNRDRLKEASYVLMASKES